MKMHPPVLTALALTVLLGVAGCGRKADATRELQRASEAMGAAPSPQPVPAGAQTPPTPAQHVEEVRASFKDGKYNDAVTQINTLLVEGSSGKQPMTPQQYMALQDAAGAVLGDLYARAAKGDAKAQQAIKEYQRLRHSH